MSLQLMKVLHIVENLERGAVENWLVRMLGHARKREIEVDWTFYCILEQPGAMDEKVRALGARVIHSPAPIVRKAKFVRALRMELLHGEYDVLHCHHDIVSAVYLLAASGMRIRRRIVHVHNADEAVLTPSRFKQRLYREPMRRVCLAMADLIVGISDHTLSTFLAGRSRREGRDLVLYYGVDPTPFETAKGDRLKFRQQLGLAEAVRQRAAELGLGAAFRHLGWRDDVPEIMCCCDWFILPRPEHRMEGLGLAVVEAQLAGLSLLL